MDTESYYDILGLPSDASAEEIKRAFRSLAREYHPDAQPDRNTVDTFQKISEAYSILSDPARRVNYDLKLGIIQPSVSEPQPSQQADAGTRRERKPSKVNIQSLHRMVREGYQETVKSRKKIKDTTKLQRAKAEAEGNSVNRLAVKPGLQDRLGSLFKRVLRKVEKKAAAAVEAPVKAADKAAAKPQRNAHKGERVYVFTIDALESVIGTVREVAFDELDEPRVLKVRIPAGVQDDAVIDAASLTDDPTEVEVVRARIRIKPHKLVERDGYDITIRVPLTVAEAVHGADIEIPTPSGTASIKIPQRCKIDQKIRLKGLGLQHFERKFKGDLYVQPVIVAPDHNSPALDEAAKMVDTFYHSSVRANFPLTLFSGRRG